MTHQNDVLIHLSKREQEVLQLTIQGQTGKVVADTLGISQSRVKNIKNQLMQKLNSQNMVQAAAMAVNLGIATIQEPILEAY